MSTGTIHLPLHTPRLRIRDFLEPDVDAVHAYGCLEEVSRFMPWGPNTEQESRDFVGRAIAAQSANPRLTYELAVIDRSDDRLIGGAGLTIKSLEHRNGFLGYCFHPRVWGLGYATEAARALVSAGFGVLNLQRIWTTCDDDNHASARVLAKVGMQQEGLLRHDQCIRGQWRDSRLLAILRDEWAPNPSG